MVFNQNYHFQNLRDRVDKHLENLLPQDFQIPKNLHMAIRYSCLNGGKRIRPLLVYLAGEWLGLEITLLDRTACAVEMIHCYSLVHDDLPAMDDDDYRRGKLSCHKAFDEGTAILVGDGLQALAFEIVATDDFLPPSAINKLIKTLAKTCGSTGMVGGQALDLSVTKQKINFEALTLIHRLKTQSLLECCAEMPTIIANEHETAKGKALIKFAAKIGEAYQIQDDIFDYENPNSSNSKEKLNLSDPEKNKPTYCDFMSLTEAKEVVKNLYIEARALLSAHSTKNQNLFNFIELLQARDN